MANREERAMLGGGCFWCLVAPKLAAFRWRFAERLRRADDARIAPSGARE